MYTEKMLCVSALGGSGHECESGRELRWPWHRAHHWPPNPPTELWRGRISQVEVAPGLWCTRSRRQRNALPSYPSSGPEKWSKNCSLTHYNKEQHKFSSSYILMMQTPLVHALGVIWYTSIGLHWANILMKQFYALIVYKKYGCCDSMWWPCLQCTWERRHPAGRVTSHTEVR